MKSILTLVFIGWCFAGWSAALPPVSDLTTNDVRAAENPAATNLARLRLLATTNTYADLGFASMAEVARAKNGQPMQIYELTRTGLTNYELGQDLATLMEPKKQLIYPVYVGKNVRSSHTLWLYQDAWRGTEWGQPEVISNLVATATLLKSNTLLKGSTGGPFAVHVPVLSLWLVGYRDTSGQMQLVPTTDFNQGNVKFQRRQALTPGDVAVLAAIARRYHENSN